MPGASVGRERQSGFTLLELVIGVAIIGLLAALAAPAYRQYIQRARISEGLVLAQPLKQAVAEFYSIHGHLPEVERNNWNKVLDALRMPSGRDGAASGRYVKRIWWHNNADEPGIYIRYAGGVLDDKLVYLNADFGSGTISWRCTAPAREGVPVAALPASCR